MSTLLTCAALAVATVLVAVYTFAQRYRLRVLEARIAAAKADLAALHSGPTVERTETLLVTLLSTNMNCATSLRPHYLAAKQALRSHPGCIVAIKTGPNTDEWRGSDEQALTAWLDSINRHIWLKHTPCTTTMTRRIPAPPTEPTL